MLILVGGICFAAVSAAISLGKFIWAAGFAVPFGFVVVVYSTGVIVATVGVVCVMVGITVVLGAMLHRSDPRARRF